MTPETFRRLTGRDPLDAITEIVGLRGKPTLTVVELAQFLRWGSTKSYEELRCGRVPAKKIGGQYVIFVPRLLLWLMDMADDIPEPECDRTART